MTSTQGLLDESVDEINVVEDKEASGSASADQVIPKHLQKVLKNLDSRQRELYDNIYDNATTKLAFLEAIHLEKRRGVCDYMFRWLRLQIFANIVLATSVFVLLNT